MTILDQLANLLTLNIPLSLLEVKNYVAHHYSIENIYHRITIMENKPSLEKAQDAITFSL